MKNEAGPKPQEKPSSDEAYEAKVRKFADDRAFLVDPNSEHLAEISAEAQAEDASKAAAIRESIMGAKETAGTKEVPQVNEVTGVSTDYQNEFLWAYTGGEKPEDPDEIAELEEEFEYQINKLKKNLAKEQGKTEEESNDAYAVIKTYEEAYPDSKYADVVNEKNKAAVGQINYIVGQINELSRKKELTRDTYIAMTAQIAKLALDPEKYESRFKKYE